MFGDVDKRLMRDAIDIAINLLQQEKTAKGGIHAEQLQAAWNDEYSLKVLVSGI